MSEGYDMTTWRRKFEAARRKHGDVSSVVAVAPSDEVLDVQFDAGYGGSEGPSVLIWTWQRVYFPVVWNGAEWLGSAPRNPVPDGQKHVGGE